MKPNEINELKEIERRLNEFGFILGSNNYQMWIERVKYDKTYWFKNTEEINTFLDGWEARIIYCDVKE